MLNHCINALSGVQQHSSLLSSALETGSQQLKPKIIILIIRSEFLSEVNCHCRGQFKLYSGLVAQVCYPCVYTHQPPGQVAPSPVFTSRSLADSSFEGFLFLALKSWLTGVQPCCVLIAAGRWIRAHSDGCEMPLRDRNGRTMDYFTMKSPEADADSHVKETS